MTIGRLLGQPLHPNAVKLGRFTTSQNHPYMDFIDPLPGRPSDTEIVAVDQAEFHDNSAFTKQSRLQLGIALPLLLSFSTSGGGAATLSATRTTRQDLLNHRQWFEDACSQRDTKEWLEKASHAGYSLYLIVGFYSAHDAKLISTCEGARGSGALAVLPHTAPSQSSVGTDRKWKKEGDMGFTAVGEQVFAVVYRKIQVKMFSKSVDKMALEGECRWKSVWDWGPKVRARRSARYLRSSIRYTSKTEDKVPKINLEVEEISSESNKDKKEAETPIVPIAARIKSARIVSSGEGRAVEPVSLPQEAEPEGPIWVATLEEEEGEVWDEEGDSDWSGDHVTVLGDHEAVDIGNSPRDDNEE